MQTDQMFEEIKVIWFRRNVTKKEGTDFRDKSRPGANEPYQIKQKSGLD